MTAIATMPVTTTEYGGFVPLIRPDEAQGDDGNALQKLASKIIKFWDPPRSLTLWPVVVIEPDAAQAEANQPAIALLRSWREANDTAEQAETWHYLQQVLDEDRLSNRPLF